LAVLICSALGQFIEARAAVDGSCRIEFERHRCGGVRPDGDGLADCFLWVVSEPGRAIHDGRLGGPINVEHEIKVDVPDAVAVPWGDSDAEHSQPRFNWTRPLLAAQN
jgi:hypothetical protein